MPQVPLKESLLWAGQQLSEAGCDTPVLDAELLAAKVLGVERSRLIIIREQPLSDAQQKDFQQLVARRSRREPLPYILGEWEFYGLKLAVSPAVLIPRPETETLVEVCLNHLSPLTSHLSQTSGLLGCDVGTGSGAIAIALAANLAEAKLYATDISLVALEIAKLNCRQHNLSERITLLEGDLLEPLYDTITEQSLDFVAANLPYIPPEVMATLSPEVRSWEPRSALDGGPDGLDLIRRLVADAPQWLKPQGLLALEISPEQTEAVEALLTTAGFSQNHIRADLAGHNRVVMGIL